MQVYFDNSATTRVSEAAARKAYEMMTEGFGNPSSLHTMGFRAEEEMSIARRAVSGALGAQEREIYFLSGATEANNLALFGASESKKRAGNKIVVSMIEHSSVIDACKRLEALGFEVTYLKPGSDGKISLEELEAAIDERTILVSLMAVNNETGAIHKIHGPKGVGALYIKRGTRIIPQHYGGEQEGRIRPGTQASPLIAAFGVAVKEADFADVLNIRKIRDTVRGFVSELKGVYINSPDDALEYILNFSVEGIKSETMLHYLAENEIYVSSGSACSHGKRSYVLDSMGLSRSRTDSALRVSFSRYNTIEQAEYFCGVLKKASENLVRK